MPRVIPATKETIAAWRSVLAPSAGWVANPGLMFERFIEYSIGDNPDQPKFSQNSLTDRIEEGPPKHPVIVKAYNLDQVLRSSENADKRLFKAWNDRWKQTALAAQAVIFRAETDWRFLPGFGQKNALEVGLCFHRYGFPYLPGSSVKGIARTAAVIRLGEALQIDRLQHLDEALSVELKNGQNAVDAIFAELDLPEGTTWTKEQIKLVEEFHTVFGSQSVAGKAIFFAAIPQSLSNQLPKLERDILNAHFTEYYHSDHATHYPTDNDSLIPLGFLTVAAGTTFLFAVGWRGRLDVAVREQAVGWLQFGIEQLGAGAKTTSGYGYFSNFKDVERFVGPREDRTKILEPFNPPSPPATEPTKLRDKVVEIVREDKKGNILARDSDVPHNDYKIDPALLSGRSVKKGQHVTITLDGNKVVAVKGID